MGVQEARAEVIHPSKSGKSVGFRLLEWQLKRALKTLGGALVNPDALESWDAWKPKPMYILVDNGLGMEGDCPRHGESHIHVYALGTRPPRCYEAVLVSNTLKQVEDDWMRLNKGARLQ